MEKKYELTDEILEYDGHTLHRIKALKDFNFGIVKRGDLGGFVESEDNLSQEGNCWVYSKAKVYGKAKVWGEARVYDEAEVYGEAKVFGRAKISENARVCGSARVYGWAEVWDETKIYGNAWISERVIDGNTKIYVPRYFSVLWYLKKN